MKLELDGAVLDYKEQGAGPPVLLIHGALIAEGLAPLFSEPALASCRLIRYHRRGYGNSKPCARPADIAGHAADAARLLDACGVAAAHIVGHSLGALIALQLALQAPERVHSLALLEAPMRQAQGLQEAVAAITRAGELCERGDKAGAAEGFVRWVAGPGYRQALEQTIGLDVLDQAAADCETFVRFDAAALNGWDFQPETARRVTAPVLLVLGDDTHLFFQSSHELLLKWLPGVEESVIYRAGHMLQMQRPRAVADSLSRFFARHPLPAAAAAKS